MELTNHIFWKQNFVFCLLSFKYSFHEMKFYVFNACSDKVSVNYSLSLGLLNTEYKPSVKKGQPASQPA